MPVACQSRALASAAAEVKSPLAHQSENPVGVVRQDFRFVYFILQYSLFTIHWKRQDFLNEY